MREVIYTGHGPVDQTEAVKRTQGAELFAVGKRPVRRDAKDKLTGRAVFTSDVNLPGMLHAAVLRSKLPHAKIKRIDCSRAEALHGVRAVLCHKNTVNTLFNTAASMLAIREGHHCILDQRIFDDTVRYVGDEVAAVAAETPEIAKKALGLIDIEYEELPFVMDPFEAEKPEAVLIHPDKTAEQSGHNVCGHPTVLSKGNIEEGFAQADKIVEVRYKIQPVKQMQMEPHTAVAQVDLSGKITVWSTTQTTHVARNQIAHVFGLPASNVRVLNPPYVGGGFGARIGLSGKAELIAVALALVCKRPVKYAYTRYEDMNCSDTRHGGVVTCRLGGKKDGSICAMELSCVLNKGAYASFGEEIFGTLGIMNTTRYRIPHIYYKGYSVYTNIAPGGAFRGFGNPQGNVAVERCIDKLAKAMGFDPLQYRLMNATQKGDDTLFPYPVDSSTLHECMRRGSEEIGWDKKKEYNAQKEGHLRRGMGMSFGTHFCNSWPYIVDYENATVSVQPDGSVNTNTACTDLGTGNNTAVAQICADAIGACFENVHLIYGDTDATPFGYGAHSTRSVFSHGAAVVAACNDCRDQIFAYLAELTGKEPEDFDMKQSIITAKDGSACFPGKLRKRQIYPGMPKAEVTQELLTEITLTDVAHFAHSNDRCFIGVGQVKLTDVCPWHTVFADVTVDTETGKVTINKLVAAHDVGRVVHPGNLHGQIRGGTVQGIGYALSEEMGHDDRGRPTHSTMHHYMLPTAMDIPEIVTLAVEADDPHGPFGAKGVGETPLVSPASAIINAVCDALDIDMDEMPLTPERVLMKLKEARG